MWRGCHSGQPIAECHTTANCAVPPLPVGCLWNSGDCLQMNRRALWLACTALTALAAPTAAQAQTAWDGSSSTDWFDATNWSAGVPTGGTSVTMDTVSPNPTVISGGAAQSFLGLIGNAPASTGQVTVTGAGSSWTNVNTLWIGQAANGTLNIQNGGTVTTATGSIGNLGGGVGTVTVTGAGSTFTNTTLVVGDFVGNGTLNIPERRRREQRQRLYLQF